MNSASGVVMEVVVAVERLTGSPFRPGAHVTRIETADGTTLHSGQLSEVGAEFHVDRLVFVVVDASDVSRLRAAPTSVWRWSMLHV